MLPLKTFFPSSKGVTLVEIMVVTVLSAAVLLSAMQIMNRTTFTFKKGSDMLNNQLLLEAILERIRSDVRVLRAVKKCDKTSFSFQVPSKKDPKKGSLKTITYSYDAQKMLLVREDPEEGKKTDFHAEKKIVNLSFEWVKFEKADEVTQVPGSLCLVLQLQSDEPGEGKSSFLPFVCQFPSKCQEESLPPFLVNK